MSDHYVYINPRSHLVQALEGELLNFGKAAFQLIKTFDDSRLDDDKERIRLTHECDEATFTKVGTKWTSDSLFEWIKSNTLLMINILAHVSRRE